MYGTGTIALVGSGEFLPTSDTLDRVLLARLPAPARVAIVPTASAPDGPTVFARWGAMGIEHYTRLGAQAEAVMLATREDAHSADFAARIRAANLVYLSGGKPPYLVETLRGTPAWDAIQAVFVAGGVVAGCSAGAVALAGEMGSFPSFWQTSPALGLAPKNVLVIPHFDEFPGVLAVIPRLLARERIIVGVPRATGFVGAGQDWEVAGTGQVAIFTTGGTRRYGPGERVHLAEALG